jgi:hypothetical protein
MDEFADIVIVDLDVGRTTWSRVHSSMRTLHLRLNRDPHPEWKRLFFEERNSRVELKRHGLWIEDGYIVFDCLLIDVDAYHLPDIRQSIDYANARSRVLVEERHSDVERQRDEAKGEQRILAALRAGIREERVADATVPEALAPVVAQTPRRLDPVVAQVSFEQTFDVHSPEPEPAQPDPLHVEREMALKAKRDDWRARFRAALQRNQ